MGSVLMATINLSSLGGGNSSQLPVGTSSVLIDGVLNTVLTTTKTVAVPVGIHQVLSSAPVTVTSGSVSVSVLANVLTALKIATAQTSITVAVPVGGAVWLGETLPVSTNWQSVTYGNGLFVAVAQSTSIAATSPDGITWTQRVLPVSTTWQSVTYGNGVFVAVAISTSIAATSPDGITWTQRVLPVSTGWYSVTYGNGLFVAVAYNTSIAATSISTVLPVSFGVYASPATIY